MPQFAPGEERIAIAPIKVMPSGLSCEAELFLGADEATKVATSGMIGFTSTGVSQDVFLPVIMPATEGTYHVFIDIYAEGLLIAAYEAIEDVVIRTPVPVIETLRPNAPGDATDQASLSDRGDEPNWRCVDDVVPDDDETYVSNNATRWKRDLYRLPSPVGSGTINFIKVYYRVTGRGYSGMRAKQSIKSNGIVTDAPQVTPPTGWRTFSRQWDTNPANGQPWTKADMTTLQIGISLLAGEKGSVRCTQVDVDIHWQG